ncbi:iron complex transport system ATP-binding protein [Formivibrio citricus]|uniref:Iron complex transport system ATP-binding protein n=1 Tax=Formivibrio citricus TaxID=83765 RepID=A0A1I4WH27_9NEIS|nr:heme ABC transporter ATP-binding protein [Formivibrio citricus]SFN12560.1 iron complex transport system ATP-binding protein [Formivibrio citricus]
MFKLQDVHLRRGAQQALAGIDFELKAGDMVGILGSNGAGKSTLLSMLAGELHPDQGSATLEGKPLASFGLSELARRRAMLPQTQAAPFELTVEEVVGMGAYPWPERTPDEVAELTNQALADADATCLRGRLCSTLSGGEMQRVQFARVLLQIRAGTDDATRFLLLDEPTAHLDPKHQHQLLESARRLACEERIGVAAVLHDINLAARWCNRLALLKQGRLVAEGPTAEALTRDHLETTFGCPALLVPHPQNFGQPFVLLG